MKSAKKVHIDGNKCFVRSLFQAVEYFNYISTFTSMSYCQIVAKQFVFVIDVFYPSFNKETVSFVLKSSKYYIDK